MKPFLKWVGGKTQLLPILTQYIPKSYNKYIEPFVGGGALFFHLAELYPEREAIISDSNAELINAYRVVKDNVEELIAELSTYVNTADFFYEMRSKVSGLTSLQQAARMIYLNKTCFNGLYRINKYGHFNSSFGKYKNPVFCDTPTLRNCSKALQTTMIYHLNYDDCVTYFLRRNDFVYFDPVYVPVSVYSDFRRYNIDKFDNDDHKKLANLYQWVYDNGATSLLSNSNTDFTRQIYQPFKVHEIDARRNINSDGEKRGAIKELLVTSIK